MTNNWYEFTFADGYTEITRGYSRQELSVMIFHHGKLISKKIAY